MLPLQLLRRCQLAGLLGEVGRQDGELLDLERLIGTDLAVGVGGVDRLRDSLDPNFVLDRGADGFHVGVDALRPGVQVVGARDLAVGADGLKGDECHAVLAPVADHHDLVHPVASLLDLVLDRHRRNVLPALTDDELLVPARDLRHAELGDHALVPGVQPALGVDALRGLFVDLLLVLGVEIRASHVAHHDVAAAVAQLALVLLVDAIEVRGAGALRFLVDVVGVNEEDLHLRARQRPTARAPRMRAVRGDRGGRGTLRHAVCLVDVQAEGAEVLEGALAERGRPRKAEAALGETQAVFDLRQDQRVRDGQACGRRTAAADLAVDLVLEREAFRPIRERLFQARHFCAKGADLVRDPLPHQRHAEEQRGLGHLQAILDRLGLEVVGPGEEQCEVPRLQRRHRELAHHVHHHRRHVRQRQE
mmetsp:Transcript_17382/g.49360  ORF Transcript_17382/g.49360 Transcript_17382/m.49360 type:complete len:420 (-) Transcript_17382:530-1789(-)